MPSVLSKLCSLLPSGVWVRVVEVVASLGPRAFSSLSDGARVRMVDALRRILRYLQNGFDVGWQYTVSGPSIRIAIATLILADVLRPWAEVGWAPRTAEELTDMSGSGAEVELISESSPQRALINSTMDPRRPIRLGPSMLCCEV